MVQLFSRWMVLALLMMPVSGATSWVMAEEAKTAEQESSEQAAEPKVGQWAEFTLKGSYPQGAELPGLFGEVSETYSALVKRLKAAGADDNVDGILLKFHSPQVGWGRCYEMRQLIQEIQASGKPVYAWMESCETADYSIASACEKVYLPESSMLILTGLRAEVGFYKDLFEKLDIKADFLRVGKYKSAVEPYTRNEMSPEFREEMTEVLDGIYQDLVGSIAKARGLKKAAVEELIDHGPYTALRARDHQLIDGTLYEDELTDLLKADFEVDQIKYNKRYGKKKVDLNFDGFAGMMNMMNLLMGNEPKRRSTNKPQIAVINAIGPIMTGKSSSDLFGSSTMGSTTIVKALEDAAENDRVKAIVLRVDSPGGSALASDLIWRATQKIEKPIVVSMGNVAASGGYYISMGADYIYVTPSTITGSIGVLSGKLALEGLFNKIGMSTSVIKRGENSTTMSSTYPFSDSERQAMQQLMQDIYDQFTQKAAEGRKMDVAQLRALAGGRIYAGHKAVEIGLADEIGSLSTALAKAMELAKLDPETEIEQLQLPKPTSPFEQLFGPIDAQVRQQQVLSTTVNQLVPQTLKPALRQWQVIHQFCDEPALLMMPSIIEIR